MTRYSQILREQFARRPWPADAVRQADVIRRCEQNASIQVSHELDARARVANDTAYEGGASAKQALETVDETPEHTVSPAVETIRENTEPKQQTQDAEAEE